MQELLSSTHCSKPSDYFTQAMLQFSRLLSIQHNIMQFDESELCIEFKGWNIIYWVNIYIFG